MTPRRLLRNRFDPEDYDRDRTCKGNSCRERTVSDGAGLGFVKTDHSGVFRANLDLFEELQTQDNYI